MGSASRHGEERTSHGRTAPSGKASRRGAFDEGVRFTAVAGDPTETDPDKYRVVFENDRVRVLEYRDRPGDRTSPHRHPDSVMYTLSAFERRLIHDGKRRDVKMEPGSVNWLAAQEHSGENIGTGETHVLFVELKEPPARPPDSTAELGPASGR
jgi:beta-alanine degradation protein BauB